MQMLQKKTTAFRKANLQFGQISRVYIKVMVISGDVIFEEFLGLSSIWNTWFMNNDFDFRVGYAAFKIIYSNKKP